VKPIRILAAALCLFSAAAVAEARQVNKAKTARAKAAQKRAPEVEYLTGERTRPLPFSDAVRVGHMLYLSGQIGTDRSFALVPGGIKAETRQTLDNVKRVLERSGSSMERVVKCTVMMADMSEWPAMNEIYVTYFRKDRLPARSALGVSGLALGARVEIECWATVD
jgi:2-iminobutanoate/2-iminopropanoate deaminase